MQALNLCTKTVLRSTHKGTLVQVPLMAHVNVMQPQAATMFYNQRQEFGTERLQHGIFVEDGTQISDPVKRVLSIENADR